MDEKQEQLGITYQERLGITYAGNAISAAVAEELGVAVDKSDPEFLSVNCGGAPAQYFADIVHAVFAISRRKREGLFVSPAPRRAD